MAYSYEDYENQLREVYKRLKAMKDDLMAREQALSESVNILLQEDNPQGKERVENLWRQTQESIDCVSDALVALSGFS